MFSRSQLHALGLTKSAIRHRIDTGRCQKVATDVFSFASMPLTWRGSLMAACLAWGHGAAASHRAAAANWELGIEAPEPEVTTVRRRARTAPGIVHVAPLDRRDVAKVHGIPTTTIDRTLIDLAGVAASPIVEAALDDALRRGLVTLARLRWRLEMSPGRRGVATLRRMVADREGSAVSQSHLETKLARLIRFAGLPRPVQQFEVELSNGRRAFIDFAYPEHMLAIEAEGHRHHSGRLQWERDRARASELAERGWRIVIVTWTDVTQRPTEVVARIRRALGL